MPEFFNGLPLHALVVHAVVILVPLAALGAVVIAVWPAARKRFGWLVVGVTAAATASVPVATASGENLAKRIPPNELVDRHMALGDDLLIFVIPLLVVTLALVLADRLPRETWVKAGTIVVSVLVVALAGVSAVQVFRIGEAGSRAVWDYVEDVPPAR
ncbi:hypothetical protein EV193_102584 [Herbihabitans rhizosphaerae]|uniref:DUF2231 domain-containing protein n=1 Tax=Herbihabitans rhizosphaerae TaxID=1872711 RepID=A0A4V2EU76_9PSEU|nr:DUF2231 domain-containing protein [Herbihabitans rhizosphaerae]RZS43603.1 hypothetical protein EV193_102584 [Herbihabitans rhizosphaerae]